MRKRVAFICVHNSCRSQIAEAIAKEYGRDVIEAYSAGTEVKKYINPDAVRLIKSIYNIDMEKDQKPKLIEDIPKVEYLITMGCNVVCPTLSYDCHIEDWGIEDPTGKSDKEFIEIIKVIENKVINLIRLIESKDDK
ncbi:arsenate reductase ArsC [Peptoniphilaceae bacterium SGI.131]